MKLDCVLTAVNENQLYLELVPLFIKFWNKLYPNVEVKIILIAKEIPENYLCYKDIIILFEPIEDISTAFISQFIRLLYPALLDYKNGVMITDIDDFPMNNTFFTKNIENISLEKWVNLRDWTGNKQISMCWQVSTPKNWREVFQINNLEDIKNTLINENKKIVYFDKPGKSGWFTDQIYLYDKVMEWNKKTKNYICLKDSSTKFNRLDRHRFDINNETTRNKIRNGVYTDYHCLRPMSSYLKINNEIYSLLL